MVSKEFKLKERKQTVISTCLSVADGPSALRRDGCFLVWDQPLAVEGGGRFPTGNLTKK
jgi:hypothetical protein